LLENGVLAGDILEQALLPQYGTMVIRHPLFAFFLLTFAISWGIPGLLLLLASWGNYDFSIEEYSPLSYLAVWSPAIAAMIIVTTTQGWLGLRQYLRRLLLWRVHWGWYAGILLGIPCANFLAAAFTEATGKNALMVPTVSASSLLVAAWLRLTEGPLEELGWRGLALPLLQRRFSGWQASIILGFVWGLWHVPAIFLGRELGGGTQGNLVLVLLQLFLGFIATAIVMTVVYNATGGSLLLAFLFHWMTNFPYPWETGVDISAMMDLLTVLAASLAVVLGRNYLGKAHLYTEVIPGIDELPLK